MQSRLRLVALAASGLAACGVGVLVQTMFNARLMPKDFGMMALPLLGLLLRGWLAGCNQLRRTHAAIRTILRLPHRVLPTAVADLVESLGIENRVNLVLCASPTAFCYGLLRPRICITSGLLAALAPDELEAVLRHERHHLRRYDPLRVLLWTMISGTFWWLAEQADQAHLLRELAADRTVIAEQGRTPLASALFKLLTLPRAEQLTRRDLAISGLSVTDARIDQLVQCEERVAQRQRSWHWLLLVAVLLFAMPLCSILMAHLWL